MIPRPPASRGRAGSLLIGFVITMAEPSLSPADPAGEAPLSSTSPAPEGGAITPEADGEGTVVTAPEIPIPTEIWIDELNAAPFHELLDRADAVHVKINPEKTRHHIVFDLLRAYAARGCELYAEGVMEAAQQGAAYLRWQRFNFRSLPQDA